MREDKKTFIKKNLESISEKINVILCNILINVPRKKTLDRFREKNF